MDEEKQKKVSDIMSEIVEEVSKIEGYEATYNNGSISITPAYIDISFSGSYYMGRFGSQSSDWIVAEYRDSRFKGHRKRVLLGKFEMKKFLKKIKELITLYEENQEREKRKLNQQQEWKEKMIKTLGGGVVFQAYEDGICTLGKLVITKYKYGDEEYTIKIRDLSLEQVQQIAKILEVS